MFMFRQKSTLSSKGYFFITIIFTNFRYSVEEDGTLIIRKLRMEDSGMWQCVATNEAGSESTSTWLKVKSKSFYPETYSSEE